MCGLNQFYRATRVAILIAAAMSASLVRADTITPGTPPADNGPGGGGHVMIIWAKGPDGVMRIVPVTVDCTIADPNQRTIAKKSAIVSALGDAGIDASINSSGNVDANAKIKLGKNTSGEIDGLHPSAQNNAVAGVGQIRWEGEVTSISPSPGGPTYTAGFGFNDVAVQTTFAYASLSEPTLDAVLSRAYGDLSAMLPAQHLSRLTLDLDQNLLSFAFPAGANGMTVLGGNTSPTSWAAMEFVPEPGSLGLAGGCAVAMLARRRRRVSS